MSSPGRSSIVDQILKEQAVQLPKTADDTTGVSEPAEAAAAESAETIAESEAEAVMESALEEMDRFARGQIVNGTVVQVSSEGVLVDIGGKSEGVIPPQEMAGDESDLSPGDKIEVYVVRPASEEEEGPVLSKRRADYERVWQMLLRQYETGEVLKAVVKDRVKGGLLVDVGVEGFVPASHIYGRTRDISRYIGRTLRLKIIEVDKRRNKVVLSNRLALEEERSSKKEETLANLAEGQVVEGVVRRIADFGAFVDIGGVDGLLHVSEMAWRRVEDPNEVVRKGDKLHLVVLEFDRERERISLGLKQLLPDPWKKAKTQFPEGSLAKGRVERISRNGAFVRLNGDIEGFLPISEISDRRISSPEEVIKVGEEVEVRILKVSPELRRMGLSLHRPVQPEVSEEEVITYTTPGASPAPTLADVYSDLLATASALEQGASSTRETAMTQEAPPSDGGTVPQGDSSSAGVEAVSEASNLREEAEGVGGPASEPVREEQGTEDAELTGSGNNEEA